MKDTDFERQVFKPQPKKMQFEINQQVYIIIGCKNGELNRYATISKACNKTGIYEVTALNERNSPRIYERGAEGIFETEKEGLEYLDSIKK